MGRCRGGPFEFPIILLRPLRLPRRAGGRTNKMNSNTYLNNTYNKPNERALADLLGQLVRGRNPSPTGFNRGGGGSSGVSGGGPMNNYSSSSMGPGSGSGGWGGNAPNDWNHGGGGGGFGSGGGGGGGNMMPLMQRNVGMNMNIGSGGGGGFGGMSQGGGMNDNYGGMPQNRGGNDDFGGMQQGNNYMGMSRGNQGGFGGMPSNSGGFSGGGFPQSNYGDDGFGGAPPPPRSRGQWVSGAANRSNRNAAPPQVRGNNRPSNSAPGRRSLNGTKAPLSSRSSRSGGASASSNASRPVQAQKRSAPPISSPPTKAKISANNVKPTSVQGTKTATSAAEPRRVLTSTGGRWYQHFLAKGIKPEEARKKAFENNNKPFPSGVEGAAKKSVKKAKPPPADTYIRLAIFAKGFPENMLDPEDLSSIEELIVDEVANSSTESKLQFERVLRKPGMLMIDCLSQHTADWLKDIIPKLTNWENPELAVCIEEDIPDAYVMTISLPRSVGQEYDQTLALIQSQNDDLVTDSWEWVHEREDGDRLIVTIRIDKDSHAAIKEKKWKIFYKFGLVDVNFARYMRYALSKRLHGEAEGDNTKGKEDKPEAEDGEQEKTAETTEENPPSPPPAPVISK
ncbi:protein qua-1-like [Anastrepha obliqua]|uniref:protein qua-1-like n=1 Tax=Anastrepha obliqua TaxID=95512 RepID=UPI0024091415|nr:protein qua-1-like [Anastrepha obliqua]